MKCQISRCHGDLVWGFAVGHSHVGQGSGTKDREHGRGLAMPLHICIELKG